MCKEFGTEEKEYVPEFSSGVHARMSIAGKFGVREMDREFVERRISRVILSGVGILKKSLL